MNNNTETVSSLPYTAAQPHLSLRKKSLFASGIGNLLEWFDWTVYTVASIYIAAAMFDKSNPTSALLNTLAVFAVGFLFRPLGGIIFGNLADKLGRRRVLMTTMMLMASASLAIALIPSYGEWGAWSSAALLLARAVQGFAHGGETTASYAYIAEIAPPARRGLWSSSTFFAVGSGALLATFYLAMLTSWLPDADMKEWGWRIPFASGSVLAVFALWLRRNMMESEHVGVAAKQAANKQPWSKSKILKVGFRLFLYEAGATLTYYTWVSSAAIYAISIKGMPANKAFVASCIAQVIYLAFLPVAGWLSDRWGRKTCTLISLLGIAATVLPLWQLMSAEPWTLAVAQTCGLLLIAFITGSKPAAISEQIPTQYRTRMFGVCISLGIAVFGGTASYLSTWLYSSDIGYVFNIYLIVVALISSIVVLMWKNNTGRPINEIE